MGSTAKIDKITLLVQGHCFILHILEQLDLIGLALLAKKLDRLSNRHLAALKGQTSLDDLGHLFFYGCKIVRGKGNFTIKIVVISVFNGWTDGNLYALTLQLLNSLGHDMGAGMSQNMQPFLRQADLRVPSSVCGQRSRQIYGLSVA